MSSEFSSAGQYSSEDYIPLSYISQYLYCPRRAALMLLEGQWDDNIYTVEGILQHEGAHNEGREMRRDTVKLTSVPVTSASLGLTGKCDCVELIADATGIEINGFKGKWRVVPVEYKHGVRRNELEYEAQVCAQAICLEEMWGCVIGEGYIFYVAERRRKLVELTTDLREKTKEASKQLCHMVLRKSTPAAIKTRRCNGCSLRDLCIPELNRKTSTYIHELVRAARGGDSF